MSKFFLAGDVGVTKTALAVFSTELGPGKPLNRSTVPTDTHSTFEDLISDYLATLDYSVDSAIFAVAGPVINGKMQSTSTNLPWGLDQETLQDNLKLVSVELVNDLKAAATAVPFLTKENLFTLNSGQPTTNGALAVIAPGTGLGEAFLIWDGDRYLICESEGGLVNFAGRTPLESELLRYIQNFVGYTSYETLCSGKGLPEIYKFLKETGYAEEPDWLSERMAITDDPTPIIFEAAHDERSSNKLCSTAVQTFISILGSEAGNLALKVMAIGGVYIAGGIHPRILPIFAREKALFSIPSTRKAS